MMTTGRIDVQQALRPRNLESLSGYAEYVEIMKRWVTNNSYPKAVLFQGEIGLGKTVMAHLLAKAAACVGRKDGTTEACGECKSCKFDIRTTAFIGSRIDAKYFWDKLVWFRSGANSIWDLAVAKGRVPFVIDEVDELPKQAQRDLRAQLDSDCGAGMFLCTSANAKKIDPALRDRMYPFFLYPPSRTEQVAWIVDSSSKVKIKAKDETAAGLIVDATHGRYRAILQVLQWLHDNESSLTADEVRQACKMCGFE